MNIYLLRHGIALAETNASSGQDHERPLSSKGIKRMRKAAKGLQRLNLSFDIVLTSPLVRAPQTAVIGTRPAHCRWKWNVTSAGDLRS